MRLQTYYDTPTEVQANRCIQDVPLLVNCAGVEYYSQKFHTKRARKDFYLLYVVAGSLPSVLEGEFQILEKDTFIIVEPGKCFEYWIDEGFINYYWIHFTGSYAADLVKNAGLKTNYIYHAVFNSDIKQLFECVFNEFIFSAPAAQINRCGYLINIITYISRSHTNAIYKKMKSVEYINEHYNKQISIKKLAQMENLSISHYRAVFKKAIGMTPTAYIVNHRINAACLYLQQYEMSVKEAAYAVGYNDALYFSKVFKKVTGISPKDYRLKNNQNISR